MKRVIMIGGVYTGYVPEASTDKPKDTPIQPIKKILSPLTIALAAVSIYTGAKLLKIIK